ncbi:uncharacterized protein F5147DRAFT_697322 [Suillus discolor]|uniref:Protein-S-isoprenylcysteine O-methyltransferase n=1 Tax=Suillus discolor TaxID=1912936 RepID=A0A9P7JTU9_9AGAM|nr:uncharacterized protein F5147DRAFT_697322 [Suillus discolor]KAG2107444.1 hypothetical protein F5147DRAFT_697322 [Suillus discolor]
MSLLKIPFVVASAIGTQISLTSPSSLPPSSREKVVSASDSIVSLLLDLQIPNVFKIIVWTATSVEVANILAMHIGPSQIPEGIYNTSAVQLLYALHPTPITPALVAGSLLVTAGGVLRRYCMSTLGKFWSFRLSVKDEHRIVTNGPYSIVRHPSYTGVLLQYVGLVIMHGSERSWMRQSGILRLPYMKGLAMVILCTLTIGTLTVIKRCSVEDKVLQRATGEDWANWAKKVKYRLLPGVY